MNTTNITQISEDLRYLVWMNRLSKSKVCLMNWIDIKEKAINMWTTISRKSKNCTLKKKRKKRKEE